MRLGYSYPYGKQEIKEFLLTKLHPQAKICDIGPGEGTYYNLLGNNYHWTGIEIWHDTVEFLKDKYDVVYEADIRNFDYPEDYDLIIFGDILEHLSIQEAQEALQKAREHTKAIMVAVPYQLVQGSLYGNKAERHMQPDLTPQNFDERYPGFELIHQIPHIYGYYYWENKE